MLNLLIKIFYIEAKSPVFSHVSTTLNGLTTIRSRGKDIELMLCKEFDQYQDIHTGAWYLTIVTGSAFGLILDLISCVFVMCVCFSLILMDPGKYLRIAKIFLTHLYIFNGIYYKCTLLNHKRRAI